MAWFIVGNYDRLRGDTLAIGAEAYGINYCSCVADNGYSFYYDKNGIQETNPNQSKLNGTIYKLNGTVRSP